MFFLPIFLILFFWKNTLLHISTQLYSWYDGSFVIWVFQNNLHHFASFDIRHLYETNAMYPFPFSLSFTEHMFFPSLITWVISWFNTNPLFQFNILAVLNHILVYVCFYLFAGRFTKSNSVKVISALFTSFSPYFMGQLGHIQMVFFWPFLLSLYFIFSPKRTLLDIIFAGILLGIQFLSAVYLAMMGFGIIVIYYVFNLPKGGIRHVLRETGLFLITFFLTALPSIIGYLLMQRMYKPTYEQSQYVTYAAHITDYFLIFSNNSLLNDYLLRPLIGVFNKHIRGEMASFVGVVPMAVIGSWWLVIRGWKNMKILRNKKILIWLVLLIAIGFIFSLGPRMNWNGTYLVTPLPYWFILKFVPMIGVMRAVARYNFLIVFAISILLIFALDTLKSHIHNPFLKKVFIPLIFVLLLIEFYPPPLYTSVRDWKSPSYLYLHKACKENYGAVLEYPFEYRDRANDIGKYLALKTNSLLSSTLHSCPILSGFSAFEPTLFRKWQADFDTNGITDSNIKILKNNKFKYIKVNLEALSKEEMMNPSSVIHTRQLKEVFRDKYSILYKIIY